MFGDLSGMSKRGASPSFLFPAPFPYQGKGAGGLG